MRLKPIIFLFLPLLTGLISCSKFQQVQKSNDYQAKYEAAIDYYENKEDYYKAKVLLKQVIPILKGQEQAEKAQFYFAYCEYYQNNLISSAYHFRKFHETFPRSQYAEEAYYMHCISLAENSPSYNLDQRNTYKALDAIQEFLEMYPDTEYKDECNKIVDNLRHKLEKKAYHQARLYYKLRHYKACLTAFNNVLNDYPDSEYCDDIAYLKVDAEYKLAKNSVRSKQKERYKMAVQYYQDFIDNYPDSEYVEEAEKIYEKAISALSGFNT